MGRALSDLLAKGDAVVEGGWQALLAETPELVRADRAFMAGLEAGYKAGFYDGGAVVLEAQLQDARAERR